MNITVTPTEFHYVFFDASDIHDIAASLMERLGMTEHALCITVDETTPLGRVKVNVDLDETINISAQSGAFEDMKHPRRMSAVATATALGRALLRTRDRLDGTFVDAPLDDDLELRHVAAWDAYCVGRFAALGEHRVNQQRWRYNFRNRHGFFDASDEVFDELWSATALTWGAVQALSDKATAITAGVGI